MGKTTTNPLSLAFPFAVLWWLVLSKRRTLTRRTTSRNTTAVGRMGGNRALLLYVIVIKRNCVLKSKTNKRIKPSTNTAPGQLAQCIRARAAIVNSKRPKMGTRSSSSSASFHYHPLPGLAFSVFSPRQADINCVPRNTKKTTYERCIIHTMG